MQAERKGVVGRAEETSRQEIQTGREQVESKQKWAGRQECRQMNREGIR
jgi:hypothetical protein